MAYTTINKFTEHFNTVLYSGDDATTRNITGFGFQPDWIWNKARNAAYNHYLIDAVRGSPGKVIISNLSNAEDNDSGFQNSFKGFISDGNTIGQVSGYEVNDSGVNYVQWGWKAGGTGSSNSDGSITSTVSANTTAGFSIVKYTGTGGAQTVGHGLGVAPKMIIVKNLDSSENWAVWHTVLGENEYLGLNQTNGQATNSAIWNSTYPTSTVFSIGNNARTGGSNNYVAYCFAEVTGFSKFGKYVGNGNASGSFVYTGFKPKFVMYKRYSASGNDWVIVDSERPGYNVNNKELYPNLNSAEGTTDLLDTLSNGFKLRRTHASANADGSSYLYMAFGQTLVGSNNTPATAR